MRFAGELRCLRAPPPVASAAHGEQSEVAGDAEHAVRVDGARSRNDAVLREPGVDGGRSVEPHGGTNARADAGAHDEDLPTARCGAGRRPPTRTWLPTSPRDVTDWQRDDVERGPSVMAAPSITKGKYVYDFGDEAMMTPLAEALADLPRVAV